MTLTTAYSIILSNPIVTIPATWYRCDEAITPSGNITRGNCITQTIRIIMVELDDHSKSYWGTRFNEVDTEIWTREDVNRGDLIEVDNIKYEVMHVEQLPKGGARRLICRRR